MKKHEKMMEFIQKRETKLWNDYREASDSAFLEARGAWDAVSKLYLQLAGELDA